MSLALFEESLKQLFTTPEGRASLQSIETLSVFVAQLPLTDEERAILLAQPLDRLDQYAFMLRYNVFETLKIVFPFTQRLLGDQWESIQEDFYTQNPGPGYQLNAYGKAFPEYLATLPEICEAFPYLPELAHYEWIEAFLLSEPDQAFPLPLVAQVPQTAEGLHHWSPVINNVACFTHYHYPVPFIIEFLKQGTPCQLTAEQTAPKEMWVWVYRHWGPFYCRFFELNDILAAWMTTLKQLMQEGSRPSYADSIEPFYQQLASTDRSITREYFTQQFLSILQTLRNKDMIIGSVPVA